jgi:hypothetical protein
MTEQEWLISNDPVRMISYITSQPRLTGRPVGASPWMASDRKMRLIARSFWLLRSENDVRVYRDDSTHEPGKYNTSWAVHAQEELLTLFRMSLDSYSQAASNLRDIAGNPWKQEILHPGYQGRGQWLGSAWVSTCPLCGHICFCVADRHGL